MSPQPLHPEPVIPRGLVPPAAAAPHPLGEGRLPHLPLPPREGRPPLLPLPPGEGRGEGAFRRPGFSLVELLVVVSILLLLMGVILAAVSAARATQKRQATQSLIAKLDAVIQQQFASYASRRVPVSALAGANKSAARAVYLRKLASAELPDNWADVQTIAQDIARINSGTSGLIFGGTVTTSPQQACASTYLALQASGSAQNPPKSWPTNQYADAECLFMIVMQGGIADCLDCAELGSSSKGDTDGDGAFEFLDAWGQPIRYVLWPAGLELPPGGGRFFSTTAPFTSGSAAAAPGGTMRPLIFSCGPDGPLLTGTTPPAPPSLVLTESTGHLALGVNCGVPQISGTVPGSGVSRAAADPQEFVADNITNFDAEAKK